MVKGIAPDFRRNFGALLEAALHDQGWTHQALADALGVKKTTVDTWTQYAAKIPARPTLIALCQLLEDRKPGQGRAIAAAAGVEWEPAAPPRPQIPGALQTIWGRQTEVAQITDFLDNGCRVLTLTGPGGVGKTSLALTAARAMQAAFADGTCLVRLEAVRDVGLLAATIAHGLGVPITGATPAREAVLTYLSRKQLLLVLDNFEQLIDGADQIKDLLDGAPQLQVLITSREPLLSPWEQQLAVDPLVLPETTASLDDLRANPAMQVFADQARKADPAFRLTAENAPLIAAICQRVDGLPLALELAAAQIRNFTPVEMLRELEHGLAFLAGRTRGPTDRQQTLDACIRWSYNLLTPAQQQVFRRLAVCTGGCTWEAADAISAGPVTAPIAGCAPAAVGGNRAHIIALRDKHLLWAHPSGDETRLHMLETIRTYAAEELARSSEAAAIYAHHAVYYLALVEQAAPLVRGPHQLAWLDWLEREHDNLRAALGWAAAQPGSEVGLRLVAVLWPFWDRRGYLSEGRAWTERWVGPLLAQQRSAEELAREGSAATLALALRGAGVLATDQGDYPLAQSWLQQSLALFQALGDWRGEAATLYALGFVIRRRGEAPGVAQPASLTLFERCLALYEAHEDDWGRARALYALAHYPMQWGDFLRAQALCEQSLAFDRQYQDIAGIGTTLNSLGNLAELQGQYTAARAYYEETRQRFQELHHRWGVAVSLSNLGWVAAREGEHDQAWLHTYESLTAFERQEVADYVALQQIQLSTIARCKGDYPTAQQWARAGLQGYQALTNPEGIATALHQLGHIALQQADYDQATADFRESLQLWRVVGDQTWRQGWNIGCLIGLAGVALRRAPPPLGPQRATQLIGASVALSAPGGYKIQPADRQVVDRLLIEVRNQLNADIFATMWATGQSLTIHQAIAYALEEPVG